MDKSKKILTAGELKKMIYLAGIRLTNSGLEAQAQYTPRPEKPPFPEVLARQIAMHGMLVQKKEFVKRTRPVYKFDLDLNRNR